MEGYQHQHLTLALHYRENLHGNPPPSPPPSASPLLSPLPSSASLPTTPPMNMVTTLTPCLSCMDRWVYTGVRPLSRRYPRHRRIIHFCHVVSYAITSNCATTPLVLCVSPDRHHSRRGHTRHLSPRTSPAPHSAIRRAVAAAASVFPRTPSLLSLWTVSITSRYPGHDSPVPARYSPLTWSALNLQGRAMRLHPTVSARAGVAVGILLVYGMLALPQTARRRTFIPAGALGCCQRRFPCQCSVSHRAVC